jgi:hypothetical protein
LFRSILIASQKQGRFGNNLVLSYYGLIRLPDVETDLLITLNKTLSVGGIPTNPPLFQKEMKIEDRLTDFKEQEFSNNLIPPFLSSSISSSSSSPTDLYNLLNEFPEAQYFKQILASITIKDMSLFIN